MRWKRWIVMGSVVILLGGFCFSFYWGCYEQMNTHLAAEKKDTTLPQKSV